MLQYKQNLTTFLIENTLGGFTSIISQIITAPLNLIKMRLDNMQHFINTGVIDRPYSALDWFRKIIAQEGMVGLFRGSLRFHPNQALNFSINDLFQRMFKNTIPFQMNEIAWIGKNFLLGGLAAFTSLSSVYHFDIASISRMIDMKSGNPNKIFSLGDAYRQIFKHDGFLGLYSGFAISCVGVCVYRSFYFGMFYSLKPYIADLNRNNMARDLVLSYSIALISSMMSYPVDVVRRAGMMLKYEHGEKYNLSSVRLALEIFREKGISYFYQGSTTNFIRSIGAGISLTIYSRLQHFIFANHDTL